MQKTLRIRSSAGVTRPSGDCEGRTGRTGVLWDALIKTTLLSASLSRVKTMDTLTKTASLSASRSQVQVVMIPPSESEEALRIRGIADVTRPPGGCEKNAGRVIPHCVGPATLLRHSLPARPSQASELCGLNQSIHNGMLASSESAKNTADSGRLGREAPFGRQTETR